MIWLIIIFVNSRFKLRRILNFLASSAPSFKYLIYPLLALVYYPYQVLVEVFNENEEESVSVEPD